MPASLRDGVYVVRGRGHVRADDLSERAALRRGARLNLIEGERELVGDLGDE